jgi:Cys-rich protein (TIGR01571 family)
VIRKLGVTNISSAPTTGNNNNPHNIPVGKWRDGLCDCFIFGCCHPHCCLAYFCRALALGQVMTRMNVTPCGRPVVTSSWGPYKVMVAITIPFLVVYYSPYFAALILAPTAGSSGGTFIAILKLLRIPVTIAFVIFVLVATCKTRARVRRAYSIPETSCHGCEDCCCATWCNCCTVTQMARHTADYGVYGASCCSKTGLSEGTPPTIHPHVV